jgi:tetratricopeptide (TPR) repeat protein
MKQKRIPKTVQNQNARKIISKQILKQEQNSEKTNKKKQYFIILSCLSIFLITLFTLWGVNNNTFLNTWDDKAYIINNPEIRALSGDNLKKIFTIGTDFQKYISNYHPITMISLAINYQLSELSPGSYYLTNLLIHCSNSVLVFLLVFLLSNRRILPALFTGLWFGIHPMHVESVAWISERKDVLYSFFFILGLIVYLKYIKKPNISMYILTFLLFILSILSKAMAAPFPVILILIDIYKKRSFNWKSILEKIPLLIISVVFGITSIHLQSYSAISDEVIFSLTQRLMHASYGFLMYVWQFIYPFQLSAFYPYPAISTDGFLPFSYRIAPFVVFILFAGVVWLFYRKENFARDAWFGLLFYLFTIGLVLQFIPVGKAIMADRYSYLPYLGILFIAGMGLDYLIYQTKKVKILGLFLGGIIIVMSILFCVKSYERVKKWKNDTSIWTDALEQCTDVRMNFIYEKRAQELMAQNNYEWALKDYYKINENDPKDINSLANIGRIYGQFYGDINRALIFLDSAYRLNPNNLNVLKNLGVAHAMTGNINKSMEYLLKAYNEDPQDTSLLMNIANNYRYLGQKDKADEFTQKANALNQ